MNDLPVIPPSDLCLCAPNAAEQFNYNGQLNVETVQTGFWEQELEAKQGVDNPPYEFVFEPQGDSFLCMNTMHMKVSFKVLKADGTVLGDDDSVAPVNNVLSSLWERIDCKINDTLINPRGSKHIPYKSMIETLLSYEDSSPNTLTSSGFNQDTVVEMNAPFGKRVTACAGSKLVEVCGPICNDFIRSNNHLAPGVKLALTFHRANDKFVLFSLSDDAAYKVEIKDVKLYCRRLSVNDSTLPHILSPSLPQKYTHAHTEILTLTVPKDSRNFVAKLFPGRVKPRHLIFAQVTQSAALGEFKLNPYWFPNFDLNRLNLKMDGKMVPSNPLTPDFDNGIFAREYFRLFSECGKQGLQKGNLLDASKFQHYGALFPFDLTPDACNGAHLHLNSNDRMDENWEVEVGWSHGTAYTMYLIVFATFDSVTTIYPRTGEVQNELF